MSLIAVIVVVRPSAGLTSLTGLMSLVLSFLRWFVGHFGVAGSTGMESLPLRAVCFLGCAVRHRLQVCTALKCSIAPLPYPQDAFTIQVNCISGQFLRASYTPLAGCGASAIGEDIPKSLPVRILWGQRA